MAKNILEQAIADSKAIKEAALANAKSVLMESMKENMKEYVDRYLNEETDQLEEQDMVEDKDAVQESDETVQGDVQAEAVGDELDDLDMGDETDEAGELDDIELDLGDDLGDEDDLEEGLTEADLDEVLQSALQEVTHGQLGDQEKVRLDKQEQHDSGLLDQDMKEDGWEKKAVPAQKDWTVKESKYIAKIKQLAKENILYKKANKVLQNSLTETKLFTGKLYYANKLMARENISLAFKKRIVERLDKAKSLNEAKSIYDSFNEALNLMSEGNGKPKASKKPSLAEALGSVSDERGVSKVDASHLLEEDAYSVNRMKKLAGMLKD